MAGIPVLPYGIKPNRPGEWCLILQGGAKYTFEIQDGKVSSLDECSPSGGIEVELQKRESFYKAKGVLKASDIDGCEFQESQRDWGDPHHINNLKIES